jgi:hypothetical protein
MGSGPIPEGGFRLSSRLKTREMDLKPLYYVMNALNGVAKDL